MNGAIYFIGRRSFGLPGVRGSHHVLVACVRALALLGALAGNDAPGLVVLEVSLGQTSARVLGSAVHDLGARADSLHHG